MSYQELKSAEDKISETCDYFVSTPNLTDHEPKPLFFYHIKKTGGMTLDLVLRQNVSQLENYLRSEYNSPNYRALLCARIDKNTSGLDKLDQIEFMFLCGHLNYGIHHKISRPIDTLAVFREPYSRVLSEYTYQCMRRGKIGSKDGFHEFIKQPENMNTMCKAMCRDEATWTLEEAKANMDELTYIGLTKDLKIIIEHYLSSFGLPNVLTPRINSTSNDFLIKDYPFREDFYEINKDDINLFKYAIATNRLPKTKRHSEAVSDLTTILHEQKQKDLKLHVVSQIEHTEKVLDTLEHLQFQTVQSILKYIKNS